MRNAEEIRAGREEAGPGREATLEHRWRMRSVKARGTLPEQGPVCEGPGPIRL